MLSLNIPKLSLCMIVRNEEDYLPTCLESVKDLADEMIIVDTGSTDRTVEIATNFGAKVSSVQWCDDFSFVRNESLKHATGDWILYLDADERIDEKNKEKIRTFLADSKNYVAVNVRVVIPQPEGNLVKGFSLDYCRLFRNLPHIRFESKVHEQILPSILRAGGKVLKSDITIDHWGFGLKQDRKGIRNDRNVKLLEAEVAENPGDPFYHYHLAIAYRTVGEYNLSIQQFGQVLKLDNHSLKNELISIVHIFLAQLYFAKNDFKAASFHSENAIALTEFEPLPHYILATIDFENGELSSARERLLKLARQMESHGDYLPIAEIDESQVYLDIGNCYYLQHNLNEAELYYEKAAVKNPGSFEINFNLGNCCFRKQNMKSASRWFERALQINPAFEAARENLMKCYESINAYVS